MRYTILAIVAVVTMGAAIASADNKTTAGELVTEPPTLISLGFEWLIQGDDNRTVTVAVSYRKQGETMSIFDGDGAYNLFNVLAANYNYVEGLTIRNTDLHPRSRLGFDLRV